MTAKKKIDMAWHAEFKDANFLEDRDKLEWLLAAKTKTCPFCTSKLKTSYWGHWLVCKTCRVKWPVPWYPRKKKEKS